MTGLAGAAALGVVWGWLVGGRAVGPRPALAAAVLLSATVAVTGETAALVDGTAAAIFLVAAGAAFGVHLRWRASLAARFAPARLGGHR